jgi:predicted phosphodiesterase
MPDRRSQRDLGPQPIGLVGDVHAEDGRLEVALRFLRQRGVRTILCTGDVVDGWGNAERCCRLLQEYGVATVLGNHDEWYLHGESRDLEEATPAGSLSAPSQGFIATLPRTLRYGTPFGSALLCHGLGENNNASVEKSDDAAAVEQNAELQTLRADPVVRIVLNGHTHEAMVRHFAGLTIVNAGSLHREYEPGFLIIDFARGIVDRFPMQEDRVGSGRRLGALSARGRPAPRGAIRPGDPD